MIMAPYIGGNVTKTTHNTHFLVARMIYALFCRENDLRTFFAKTIYALCTESFCALKFAIRKVQTFWASGKKMGK